VVTIVRVSGDKVRLGIEAPADVLVLRDELDAQLPAAQIPEAGLEVEVELPASHPVSAAAELVSATK